MKPILNTNNKKNLRFLTFKRTLLTLFFAVPQVPLLGSISSKTVLAQEAPSGCPAGTVATPIPWTPTQNVQQFLSQNLSVGGVNVTFNFSESVPGQVLDSGETLVDGDIYGGLPGPNLKWNIGTPQRTPAPPNSFSTLTINFSQPVTLAPVTFLDVDRDGERDLSFIFQDKITVTASNGNNPVGVNLTAQVSYVRVTGNVAEGINENAFTNQSNGNVQATLSGPVTQIQVVYEAGTEFGTPQQDETIGIAAINVCVPTQTGSIGDTVFNDANGNNVQDPGETGIANVPLTLTSAGPDGQLGTADDTTQTTTTDSNGNYRFNNLPPGSYRVTVTNPPAGFVPTLTQPNPITLAANQTIDTVDFGFQQTGGSIGDTVFNDTNGNNVQDPGETGISNVTLTLTAPGPDGQLGTPDDTTQTTTTDNNGNYRFNNLPPGTYRVAVTSAPPGIPTLTQPNPVTLTANQTIDTVDFGFQPGNSSIGDTVFNDTNGNNVQDPGETGIPNVTLTLTAPGPDGQLGTPDDTTQTTTTDSNGNYRFNNLPPGTYRVAVTNPPPGLPTLTQPNPVTLAAGQTLDNVDFGFQQGTGSIGDTVFNDANQNRSQDPGERGLSNVTVTLTGAGSDGQFGTPDDTTQTTTTDNEGRYRFSNLPPGNYRVTVSDTPEDSTPTLTPPTTISLTSGQSFDTADFGFFVPRLGAGEPDLRLVKRITNVLRNGQPIGINFGTFDDGPGNDDNDINQLQNVVGLRDLPTPLQSGDEVEYTIYFLAQNANNVRFCDLIPAGTAYANNLAVTGVQTQPRVLSPLTPLDDFNNVCANQNSNGAVILGPVNIPNQTVGSIRFRVRVN
ncbi:MAG: SdrD B-like domain-containing protein [Scytonema sp. PMC 1069.18]|nr:SdrD B-like domain-containing protein [Scytonema sp. PMC 1069.18]